MAGPQGRSRALPRALILSLIKVLVIREASLQTWLRQLIEELDRTAGRAAEWTLIADHQRANRGPVTGRLCLAREAALLDAGAGERRMRGDAAVDHGDSRARTKRGMGRQGGAGGREQGSPRRLVNMVKFDRKVGRGAAQMLYSAADIHSLRQAKPDDPDAQDGVGLISANPEAGLLGCGE